MKSLKNSFLLLSLTLCLPIAGSYTQLAVEAIGSLFAYGLPIITPIRSVSPFMQFEKKLNKQYEEQKENKAQEVKNELGIILQRDNINTSNIKVIADNNLDLVAGAFTNIYGSGEKYILVNTENLSLEKLWPDASQEQRKLAMKAILRHELAHLENNDLLFSQKFRWLSIIPIMCINTAIKNFTNEKVSISLIALSSIVCEYIFYQKIIIPYFWRIREKNADLSIKDPDDLQALIDFLKHAEQQKSRDYFIDTTYHPPLSERITYLEKHLAQITSEKQSES